ncbi:MAG: dihydroorotase [Acidimicrobiales bacterium]|nr:dihydroorotase [Acidimicrobiales bacterium]RZV48731.1 MAG: dihydroorotase [Acidimicrobiales bacterium]
MSTTQILRGGTVTDQRGTRRADVAWVDGVITDVADSIDPPVGSEILDASDAIVMPGLVDLHAHLREPGQEEAETIETGARGAALGGFTAVVAMPNTTPTMDHPSVVRDVLAIAEGASCEVVPSAAMTVGREGKLLSPMGELASMGVRIFTDDGDGVQDAALMLRIMEYASGLAAVTGGQPIVLAQHCEVASLSAGGHMHEGEWSGRLGMGGQPSEAETLMIVRDIMLSRRTGAHIHMQHVSTAEGVELIRHAKADGVRITSEATTHHFTLTDENCATYDPVFKVHPPLRTAADVAAIKAGLADGTIDAIATDHAPHEPHTKEFPFDQAPPGMLGLETALSLATAELELDMATIAALMSWKPAAIAGIGDRHGRPIEPGEPANLCVFDPSERWTISGTEMASRSQNSPYTGREATGRVRHTIFNGDAVVLGGEATR